MTRYLRANDDTPRCEHGVLLSPNGASVVVGSEAWFSWLSEPAHTKFYFADAGNGCTLRRETRGENQYWYAYARRGGKLRKAYLGSALNLNLERLCRVARQLTSEPQPVSPTRAAPRSRQTAPDLLIVKLHEPMLPARFVARPGLTAQLNAALNVPLALLIAPAGYGKSTLLAEWLAQLRSQSSTKIAWLALDANDNDPVRFWRYVLAALERIHPGLATEALALLQAGQPADAMLISLINRIAATPAAALVLVLDDYHMIEAPAIQASMATLLTYSPPNLHVVLSTRTSPNLPLARLRVQGQLIELKTADLRFNQAEIARFLREVMQLQIPPDELAALERSTEGWVAGIQLLALAQIQGADTLPRSTAQGYYHLRDYLADEVFARLDPTLRAFLLDSSVVDRFCVSLCTALHPDGPPAQQMLDQIERAHMFLVPLDPQRSWFRYHHLFSKFLREQLARYPAERLARLHSQAARWFDAHGLTREAITHALASGDHAYAGQLIGGAAEQQVRQGEVLTLHGWLEALPREQVWNSAELSIWYTWTLTLTRQFAEAEPWLRRIEQLNVAPAAAPDRPAQLGQVAVVRATIAAAQGDLVATIRYAEVALTTLPPRELVLRSVVALNLGLAQAAVGNPIEASATLTEALELSRECAHYFTYASAAFYLGRLYCNQGRLRAATSLLRSAYRHLTAHDQLLAREQLNIALAEILCMQQQFDAAEQLLGVALPLLEHSGFNTVYALGCLMQARIHTAHGAMAQAHTCLAAAEAAAPHLAELATWRVYIENNEYPFAPSEPLTSREHEVLALIAEGLSDAAIAQQLGIAVGTARWHTKRILAKLGVSNRTQAALAAHERHTGQNP